MTDFNPIIFIWELAQKIIELGKTAYNFLFTEITILDITISVWQLIGGVGLIVVLIAIIIKAIVPLV